MLSLHRMLRIRAGRTTLGNHGSLALRQAASCVQRPATYCSCTARAEMSSEGVDNGLGVAIGSLIDKYIYKAHPAGLFKRTHRCQCEKKLSL